MLPDVNTVEEMKVISLPRSDMPQPLLPETTYRITAYSNKRGHFSTLLHSRNTEENFLRNLQKYIKIAKWEDVRIEKLENNS